MDQGGRFAGRIFDVAVVGLGAFGSQALWRLAARGLDVAGIEQFHIGHPFGSSHGATRLFRVACLEHPGLVPVAQQAQQLWRELETESGAELLLKSGALMLGPPDGRAVAGTRAAARRNALPVAELSVAEVRARFPAHAGIPEHYVGLWDAEAGVLRAEAAVQAAVRCAEQRGATVFAGARVHSLREDGPAVRIETSTGFVRASQVVVAAGPWVSMLCPQVRSTVVRVPVLWFRGRGGLEPFELARFPVFIRHYDEQHTMWGHGATGGELVKVGLSVDQDRMRVVDPDTIDRAVSAEVDWARLGGVLEWAVPDLDPVPVKAQPCMITNSADGQFVVGRSSQGSRVLLACGCSGHGFKHASAIGEAVARQVVDEEPFADLEFMSAARFRHAPIV